MDFDLLKDKTFRDSLKNDIMLLNPIPTNKTFVENSKNMSRNRVLFELQNSACEEEKNFIEMNKKMASLSSRDIPKKQKINDKTENFGIKIFQSKITKNMKSVMEMVIFFKN